MYTEKQQDEIKRLRTENKDLTAKVIAMEAQLYPAGSKAGAPQMEHKLHTNLGETGLSSILNDGWRAEMLQFVHTGDGVVQLCGVFVREKRVQPGPVVQPARASSVVVSTAAILTADEVALSTKPTPQEPAPEPAQRSHTFREYSAPTALPEPEIPVPAMGEDDESLLAWLVCRRYARMQEDAQRVADEMEPTIKLLVLGIRDRRIDLTPEQFELALLVKLGVTDTTRGGMHLSPFGNLVGDILDAERKAAAEPVPAAEAEEPVVRQLSDIPPAAVPATGEGWMVGQSVVTRRGRAGKVVEANGDRLVLIESARERRDGKAVRRWHYTGDLMQA